MILLVSRMTFFYGYALETVCFREFPDLNHSRTCIQRRYCVVCSGNTLQVQKPTLGASLIYVESSSNVESKSYVEASSLNWLLSKSTLNFWNGRRTVTVILGQGHVDPARYRENLDGPRQPPQRLTTYLCSEWKKFNISPELFYI